MSLNIILKIGHPEQAALVAALSKDLLISLQCGTFRAK
jgi:hypothetical protein